MRRKSERIIVVAGTFFSALIALFLAGALYVFLNNRAFFLPGLQAERCAANLEAIALAKAQASEALALTNGAPLTEEDLVEFLPGGTRVLRCPGGGACEIGSVGVSPRCSVHAAAGE